MGDTFQVMFGDPGQAAPAWFYDLFTSLEVEENADLPGAIEITLPIATMGAAGSEDLTNIGRDEFQPYARIAVVATPESGTSECIFEGYVLSHKIHLDRGTTAATLRVWGQDVSCLMNLKEQVHEWEDTTDGKTANVIFQSYGFIAADANTDDDSPQHTKSGHTLMQRATDAQFLRDRARRNGKLFRVCCGATPGSNTGYFITPKIDSTPDDVPLTLNPPDAATVDALDFEWDIARPSTALAKVLLLTSKDSQSGDSAQSGLSPMDARSLAAFTGQTDKAMEARLTAAADSTSELQRLSAALLTEAGWFVRCEGETDLARLHKVLRVGRVVQINGAGKVHSGNYFVWSVRHTITAQAHRMRFVLVRNAVGSP